MNLTKFVNEVDEITKTYDREKLLQIIHEVARTLPESSRNDFIQQIKNIEKAGKVSSKQKNQALFKQQYEHWNGVLLQSEKSGNIWEKEAESRRLCPDMRHNIHADLHSRQNYKIMVG